MMIWNAWKRRTNTFSLSIGTVLFSLPPKMKDGENSEQVPQGIHESLGGISD